jgi:hypothetical protein
MAFNFNLPSITESYANLASFPATGSVRILYKALNNNNLYTWNGSTYVLVDKKFASSWGSLSDAPVTTTSVSKDDIGLGNADNTSDSNKPISTATQTALNAKQATLVSGTNIKTINGESVLGSGDIVISGGGGASASGIHALVKPRTGRRVIQNIISGATTGANFTVNRLVLTPFIPANTFTISEILMNSNASISGSLCRLLIYSDNNGVPNSKLYESANLNLATSGFKIATTTFTFNAGTTYWLGFHGGAVASNIIQNPPAIMLTIANNPGSSSDNQSIFFVTAVLGLAPATITNPTAAFGNAPWIALTPA